MAALGWIPYLGQTDSLVSKRILGRYPVKIQEVAEGALDAFEQALIATGYENPCDWTGSYMKRVIAGTDMWSTHAYGTAIDLDYGGHETLGSQITLLRKFPRWYVGVTAVMDHRTDDLGLYLTLWPEGVPELRLGSGRATLLGESDLN